MSSSPSPLSTGATLPPGFRFHPTDEELIMHYLRKRISAAPCPVPVIADVDIYKFDPWDLPAKAVFGDREWYFFTPRDRKYPNGVRPNRSAASGYWKATGTDKPIQVLIGNGGIECTIGVKKALVFYVGKPPRGMKTNWIMHEYRLADVQQQRAGGGNRQASRTRDPSSVNMRLDDWVLCRIFMKAVPVPPAVFSPQPPDLQQDAPAPPAVNMMSMHEPSFQLSNAPMEPSVSDFLENNLVLSDMLEAVPEPDLPPMVPDQAQLNEAEGLIEQYMQMSGEESYLTGGSSSSIATSEGIGYMEEIINGHNAMLQESADENSLLLDDASMPMNMNNFSDEFGDGFTQSLLMGHDFFGSQL